MSQACPFRPHFGSNQVLTPAAGAASVPIDGSDKSVLLVNVGANVCHVRISNAATTATAADLPIRAGSHLIVEKMEGFNVLSHISAAGTTLHVMTGEGGS